jgi:putative membrane protein
MRRLHRLSAVLDAAQGGLQLGSAALFGSFVLANETGFGSGDIAFLLAPAAFLLGVAYQVAYYYRFTYELTDEELIVASGVVGRQKREIPLERIQNVDVRRPALKRALGLAVVNFETAGGSSTEATLDAVDTAEADRLQNEIGPRSRRRRRSKSAERSSTAAVTGGAASERGETDGTDGPVATEGVTRTANTPDAHETADRPDSHETTGTPGLQETDEELLYEVSDHELRVLSVVSFRPGAFAVPFIGIPFGGEEMTRTLLGRLGIDLQEGVRSLAALDVLTLGVGAVGLLVSYLLAVWVVSIALTYLQYYDFRLERVGDELRYERGLIGRYSGTIPLGKVQTVTVGENVLMRRLGYAALGVETAGYAPGANGGSGSETTVPLGARDRVLTLAQKVLAASDDTGRYEASETFDETTDVGEGDDSSPVVDPALSSPEPRARKRYTRRYLIALGLLAAAIGTATVVTTLPTAAAAVPVVLAPLTPVAARLKYRHRGYHETAWSLVTRAGFWRRRTRIVPVFRLQNVLITRTIFQRRWGLASVTADTASSASIVGGEAVIYDVDPERADEIRVSLLERLNAALAERKRAALAGETDEEFEWVGDAEGATDTDESASESPGDVSETLSTDGAAESSERPEDSSVGPSDGA